MKLTFLLILQIPVFYQNQELKCAQNKTFQSFTVVLFLSKNIKELELRIEKLSIIYWEKNNCLKKTAFQHKC